MVLIVVGFIRRVKCLEWVKMAFFTSKHLLIIGNVGFFKEVPFRHHSLIREEIVLLLLNVGL